MRHNDTERTYAFVIDTEQLRPGCALIQAAMKGDYHNLQQFFDTEEWLLSLTPGMKLLSGTRAEWEQFAARARAMRQQQAESAQQEEV